MAEPAPFRRPKAPEGQRNRHKHETRLNDGLNDFFQAWMAEEGFEFSADALRALIREKRDQVRAYTMEKIRLGLASPAPQE